MPVKLKLSTGKEDKNDGGTKVSINLKRKATSESPSVGGGPAKPVPRIKVKTGRKPGDGYDSEDPDREENPVIEEAIILRMLPGEHLEYLQGACRTGDWSQVQIKFLDSRQAVVSIYGQPFAAQLVDLPTITEAHKSFDKKNIYKTADICQMLLVTEPIESEADILEGRLTQKVSHVYPHGLTPPMHNARKRRFRKRVSNRVIEAVEAKVDELFEADEAAEDSKFELLTAKELYEQSAYGGISGLGGPAIGGGAGAGGGLSGVYSSVGSPAMSASVQTPEPSTPFDMLGGREEEEEEGEDLLGMELERALGEGEGDEEDEEEEEEADGDEDDEDEDDNNEFDSDNQLDDDQLEAMHQSQLLREEIGDLERALEAKKAEAARASKVNAILGARTNELVAKFQQELDMKKAQLEKVNAKEAAGNVNTATGESEKDEDKDEADSQGEEDQAEGPQQSDEGEDEEDDVADLF